MEEILTTSPFEQLRKGTLELEKMTYEANPTCNTNEFLINIPMSDGHSKSASLPPWIRNLRGAQNPKYPLLKGAKRGLERDVPGSPSSPSQGGSSRVAPPNAKRTKTGLDFDDRDGRGVSGVYDDFSVARRAYRSYAATITQVRHDQRQLE